MSVPVVAIVGRPNVGKSSLFNWLAGRRIAIVDPTAGVTRDRLTTLVSIGERFVELTDTGGIGIQDVDNLTEDVEKQIQLAIQQAAVILFVVDARSGPVPLDTEVAERLRLVNKPILLVVNKCDTNELESQTAEFFRLGHGAPILVSAQQGRGKTELLEEILNRLPPDKGEVPDQDVELKLAIVGRRNTGKSTFINCLAGDERVIVSEVAGTTRDSVDVRIERDGKTFLAIDTAGVRRKKSLANDIEFYSIARAERSVRRADVVLLFLDPYDTVSKLDKQLADYVLENHKPAIFVINKWDLVKSVRTGKWSEYLQKHFPNLDYVPVAFISAKSGKNVPAVLDLARSLQKQAGARISTGDLNRVVREAVEKWPPPMRQNRRPKIYYATQVGTNPPSIVLFTNGPDLFSNTYQRYLIKTFRDQLAFGEVPIKLYLRARHGSEKSSGEEREDVVVETAAPSPKRKRGKEAGPELWKDI